MIAHYSLPPEGNLKINESFKEMFGFISLIGLPTDQILIAHLRAKFMDSQKNRWPRQELGQSTNACCFEMLLHSTYPSRPGRPPPRTHYRPRGSVGDVYV